jgi:tripartite-type tricarboxylate transporter receptor subunit TctC
MAFCAISPFRIHFMTKRFLAPALFALAAFVALPAAAESAADYPSRPVTIIVPFPPGGNTDISGRIIADALTTRLGKPFIVENKGGAGGIIGAKAAASAAPDGYTLLLGGSGPTTISPLIYKKAGYEVARDFVPVSLLSLAPIAIVVHPSFPAKTVADLIAIAKAKPDQVTVASAGNGSSSHLANELFQMMAGVKLRHVPYRGGGPAVADLVGGHVNVLFDQVTSTMPYVAQGSLRALAVTSLKRLPAFPDVPTVDESGVKGYEVESYTGLLAPAGTPPAIVEKLNAAIVQILHDPQIRSKFTDLGAEPVSMSPNAFSRYLAEEQNRWAPVISKAGIKID